MAACLIIISAAISTVYLLEYEGAYINKAAVLMPLLAKTDGKSILIRNDEGKYSNFEVRGVDIGTSVPAKFSSEYGIEKNDYLRWFEQIQEMGANTVRVCEQQNTDFYEAFYEYNKHNSAPLYLLQGIKLDNLGGIPHESPLDNTYLDNMIFEAKTVADVIHGKRISKMGIYVCDVSQWVIGYVFGNDWENINVAYINESQVKEYCGKYICTTKDSDTFEAVLAKLGDSLVKYETDKYGSQCLISFLNSPQTDPFEYSKKVTSHFHKSTKVDAEHITGTENFKAGVFAAYSVYPYYPDYLRYEDDYADYKDENGQNNTYRAYLERINRYHTIPVVIAGYGVPSSRGMTQRDINTGRNQGGMSETQQAQAVVQCCTDIMSAGCAGGSVYAWQDNWNKSAWNTVSSVDVSSLPYWNDYQTSEQHFGLLSFESGKDESICYADGNSAEWSDAKTISFQNGTSLKMMYDEKFMYFLVESIGLDNRDKLYIPIDTTQKSGAVKCKNYNICFDRPVDFVIAIDGADSKVTVQRHYCTSRAVMGRAYGIENPYIDAPAADDETFCSIDMFLQTSSIFDEENAEYYETGVLVCGNSNPNASDFNSLADYCFGENCVEIKLPWQMLNFSNPSKMQIHDDYYAKYGIEYMSIDRLYAGAVVNPHNDTAVLLGSFSLKGWGSNVEYHERLKPLYYALQNLWAQ